MSEYLAPRREGLTWVQKFRQWRFIGLFSLCPSSVHRQFIAFERQFTFDWICFDKVLLNVISIFWITKQITIVRVFLNSSLLSVFFFFWAKQQVASTQLEIQYGKFRDFNDFHQKSIEIFIMCHKNKYRVTNNCIRLPIKFNKLYTHKTNNKKKKKNPRTFRIA